MTTTTAKRDAHADNLAAVAQLADRPGASALKAELAAFVRVLGVGGEFQSVDFTRRLYRNGRAAGPDLRALGGLVIALKHAGVIAHIGYRPDGGNPYTNHHSANRPVYRVVSLAPLSSLGWEDPA